jgi:hypothetical protein
MGAQPSRRYQESLGIEYGKETPMQRWLLTFSKALGVRASSAWWVSGRLRQSWRVTGTGLRRAIRRSIFSASASLYYATALARMLSKHPACRSAVISSTYRYEIVAVSIFSLIDILGVYPKNGHASPAQ